MFSPDHPPRTILVAATRRIGDVLLTTPLVRSLKTKWPQAQIDMLVFRGTEGVLEHNPDVRRVITVAQRAGLHKRLHDALSIWRRYDLACAALSSDRPRFYAWLAGRKRAGLVDPERLTWLTSAMLHRIAINRHQTDHTVVSTLALAQVIGVQPVAEIVAPRIGDDPARRARFEAQLVQSPAVAAGQSFVVLHPHPMFVYKQWRLDAWVEMIRWLRGRGFAIALSGGFAVHERKYAERIVAEVGGDVLNLVGRLTFGESAELVRRACLFIGPDTGATHVAAATGTLTIALFGPSDPVRWGPWPNGWPAGGNPWPLKGSGRHGNVYLLQAEGDCVPCRHEGCERRAGSRSECLVNLGTERVKQVVAQMLGLAPSEASAVVDTSRLLCGGGVGGNPD